MTRILIAAAATALLLAGVATADTIYLKGGASLEGEVLEMGESALVLTLAGLEGSRVTVPLSRISDYSLYELKRARIDRKSAADREALADWALERGLLAFALQEYRIALKIAGDLASPALKAKLAKTSGKCGADVLERATRLRAEGQLEEAKDLLKHILKSYPGCAAAETAREELPRIEAQIEKAKKEAREKKAMKDVRLGLALVQGLLDKGDRLRRIGFLQAGHLGRAEDAFLAAIEAYREAVRAIERLRKLPSAREVVEEIEVIEDSLARRLVNVYVDIGHNFILKGNLIRANHYMGLALAIDPNDPKALGLRQAISIATATGRFPPPR